jgi:hypothetical protein
MAFDLEGYVTVPQRIAEFRDRYPDGRLKQKSLEFIRDFAGKDWVVFTAEAWRTADDPAPAEGTAWEPVPGATQFTRDSEVQNAETAAWGRAIVAALAADTTKGIASKEEVRNRSTAPADAAPSAPEQDPATVTVLVNEWIEQANAAETIPALQAVWEAAGAAGVTGDRRMIDATNARKAELKAVAA